MRDFMLVLHFIGLAMGLGASISNLFLGIASQKLSPEEAMKFRMNTKSLMIMGHTGLALLLLSGGYLMTPYWESLNMMPFMITKLILVVVLILLILYLGSVVRQAAKGDAEKHFKKLQPIGKLTLSITIIIVICAVLTFH